MLYIHIPFCHSKCIYCDFYSMPGGKDKIHPYVDAIISELDLRRGEIKSEFKTIYIGGGTPSILPRDAVEKLFKELNKRINVTDLDEFTIEVNPEDVTHDLINFYIDYGVNRISMGIQSFDAGELSVINRRHSPETAIKAVECIINSKLNFNCDLIYGLPCQTAVSWKKSLDTLLSYEPPHFSAYMLSYEPGTKLNALRSTGRIKETPEDMIIEMYHILCEKSSRNGYDHYEISNFGRPGMHAIHNSRYWTSTPYLGIGASAHSYDGSVRRYNPSNINSYINSINAGENAYAVEAESEDEKFNDVIITALRTSSGLDINTLTDTQKQYLMETSVPLINRGMLAIDGSRIFIPEEKWLTADDIMRRLIRV